LNNAEYVVEGEIADLVQKEVIYSWFAFCTSLQGTMIASSVFQPHTNTKTLSSFSRGQKLTQGIVLNQ